MASSSSANKVAKLAQKGRGKKVRFQGGTVFPLVVAIVVVVFGALIVYARQSRPSAGAGAPTASDTWYGAIGFYVCDANGLKWEPNLSGKLDETDAAGALTNRRFAANGINSQNDGVMHWHPSSTGQASGSNARLGLFLTNYGVTLSNTVLAFPAAQGGEKFDEAKSVCKVNGTEKKASLKVWVWSSYARPEDSPAVYTASMGDIRILNDGMMFTVAFVPDDVAAVPPPSAFELKQIYSGNTPSASTIAPQPTGSTVLTTGTNGVGATGTPATGSTVTGSTVTGSTVTGTTVAGEPSTATTGP